MAPSRKRSRAAGEVGEASDALPAGYEELAALHTAVLAICGFLSPKGVPCTLGRLHASVRSMAKRELGLDDLRRMVALDNELALRACVTRDEMQPSAPARAQAELVLRRAERMTLSAGAVRSRQRRFRQLLIEHLAGAGGAQGGELQPFPLAPLPAGLTADPPGAPASSAQPAAGVHSGAGSSGGGFVPELDSAMGERAASAWRVGVGDAQSAVPAGRSGLAACGGAGGAGRVQSARTQPAQAQGDCRSPNGRRSSSARPDAGSGPAGWSPERQALKAAFTGLPSPALRPLRRGTEQINQDEPHQTGDASPPEDCQGHGMPARQRVSGQGQPVPDLKSVPPGSRSTGLAKSSPPPSQRARRLSGRNSSQAIADPAAAATADGNHSNSAATSASADPSTTAATTAATAATIAPPSAAEPTFPGDAAAATALSSAALPAPLHPSTADRFLNRVRLSSFYRGQLVYIHEQPAQPASRCAVPAGLSPAVSRLLDYAGISSLYSHQAAAISQLIGGGHVMLATPTASGKSLAYNLPVLHAMLQDPKASAVYRGNKGLCARGTRGLCHLDGGLARALGTSRLVRAFRRPGFPG